MVRTSIDLKVLIRGGGEMASGIVHRLHQSHMKVLITEVPAPTAVRRTLAFAEAVYLGSQTIENVKAVLVKDAAEANLEWQSGHIPLLVDPDARIREIIGPDVIVDAIMAKKNSTTKISDAPLVIGIGPGFVTGSNAHAIVESNRGYNLGRVIWNGTAEPDTGIPAAVSGYAEARVFRAPQSGRFTGFREIGDPVQSGECVAEVDGIPIKAQISGMIRGILRSGIAIAAGVKVGDIDPRGEREYCYTISDKARAIGGGVLEAILHSLES
ncbi:MAG: selenium-dependent molybdenum cofactor biosynthesis protein YqeB [Deltaproteobacteria bacterium]